MDAKLVPPSLLREERRFVDVEEALLLDVNGDAWVGLGARLLRGKIILPGTAVKLGSSCTILQLVGRVIPQELSGIRNR